MSESITYKEVRKAAASDAEAGENWRKIGEISGAGHIPVGPDGEAAEIDISDVSDSKKERIHKIINPEVNEVVIDEKKRGTK